jgi:menaquinone-specific isochorismate synthase
MNKTSHTDTLHPDEFLENFDKSKQAFLSFAVRISPINFNLLLDHFVTKSSDVFYFSQPEKESSFLSFDELTIQTFKSNEFNKIANEIRILNKKLISNHTEFPDTNFPVFLTCAKFPLKKESEEWKDFGEIDFLIPRLSLFKKADSYFLLYNILTESFSSQENLNLFLEQQANKIYQLEAKLTENFSGKSVISIIEQSDDEVHWSQKISDSIEAINQKRIEKIVLSRRLKFKLHSELNWQTIFNDLNRRYPTCTNFLIKSGNSVFFGSTPELLARFSGNQFFTEALAGSIKRGNNTTEDNSLEQELLKSKKNKFEHDVVTNHIKSSINNFLENIEIDEQPVVKKFSNIQHLQTTIKGILKSDANIFDIITYLFPTPAVCGIPKEKTLQLIRESEEFDRGLFSGLIGWFNCKGDGDFSVAIRSALIKDNKVYAYAGCGIVDGSKPAEEFQETILKLKPILSLFDNAD